MKFSIRFIILLIIFPLGPVLAQGGYLSEVSYSGNVDYINGSAATVKFNDVQIDVFQGQIGSESPQLISNSRDAHVDGYYKDSNGFKYFSLDIDTNINGSLGTVLKSDIIKCVNSTCSGFDYFFDSSAQSMLGVNIDAFTLDPENGDLIFSVDSAAMVGGILVMPADLIRFNSSGVYSLEYDSSASIAAGGIGVDKNIDAIAKLSNGHYIVSLENDGNYNGEFEYLDTDILDYFPFTNKWSILYTPFGSIDNPVNVTSLMGVVDEIIFKNGFEISD